MSKHVLGKFVNATYFGKTGKKTARRRYYIHLSDKDGKIVDSPDFPFQNGDMLMLEILKNTIVVHKAKVVYDE